MLDRLIRKLRAVFIEAEALREKRQSIINKVSLLASIGDVYFV